MRPSDGRFKLWPAAVILIVFVFAAVSTTPTVKLNSTPPADFVVLRGSAAGPEAALAKGYWEVTTRVIQLKYSRTTALPAEAPAEFRLVDGTGKPTKVEDQAARAAYWTKVRMEWLKPDNWHTSYGIDWEWPVRNAKDCSRAIMQFINKT